MTKELDEIWIRNCIKKLEESQEYLLTLLNGKEEPKKESKVWKPENNEGYFYIDEHSYIEYELWENGYTDLDAYEIGNVYRTKEEAEKALAKIKARVKIQRYADEVNEEGFDVMNIGEKKWFVDYNCLDNALGVDYCFYNVVPTTTCYDSKEKAEQAIIDLQEEYLILFGVK